MFPVRSLTRAIPKSSFRQAAISSRALSTIQRPSVLRSAWTVASKPSFRTFTSSPYRFEPAGEVDLELSAKLESELALENESKEGEQIPEALQDYINSSGFDIQDTPGIEDVILTKKFGNESVKVTFSIADLSAIDEDPDQFGEDGALDDEIPQSKDRSQSENAEFDEDGDLDLAPGFPVRVNVTVTKPNGSALQLETIAQDGLIDIENVYYFPKADLADAQTAEKDFKRQEVYAGPPFSNLDEELQILFERYLDERGVNAALAQFVPDYIDFKEQREYVQWLGNVKGFVEA